MLTLGRAFKQKNSHRVIEYSDCSEDYALHSSVFQSTESPFFNSTRKSQNQTPGSLIVDNGTKLDPFLKRQEMKAFCYTAFTNTKNPGEFWKR